MVVDHTPLDGSTTQTTLDGDGYRGRGDSTVEHRPEDDAVLITDGGTNLDARVTCEQCGATSPAGETAPPGNCAGGTVFESEHEWRALATDGGFDQPESARELEVGDEIVVPSVGTLRVVDRDRRCGVVDTFRCELVGGSNRVMTYREYDLDRVLPTSVVRRPAADGGTSTLDAFGGEPVDGVGPEPEPRDVDFDETSSCVELSPPADGAAGDAWATYRNDGFGPLRSFEGYSRRQKALRDMNESGGADA